MQQSLIEDLIITLEVALSNFTVFEVRPDLRLNVAPQKHAVCHLVIRGEGSLEAGDQCLPFAQGSVLIVPPGIAKRIRGADEVVRDLTEFEVADAYNDGLLLPDADGASLVLGCASVAATCGGMRQLFQSLHKPMAINVGRHETFVAGFHTMLEELSNPGIGGKVIVDCMMKHALVLVLREEMRRSEPSPLLEHLGDGRIIRAAAAMLRRPEDGHGIVSLAALSGMSRSSFVVHFTQRYGKSPGEFLRSVRMQAAARLLSTSTVPIKRLAGTVGYSSRSQFSRTFNRTYGMSPTTYRALRRA